jgi:hypothetical protein
MRKRAIFLSFVLLVAIVILSGCSTPLRSQEEIDKERTIINELEPLVKNCHEYDAQNIAIYGNILGADLTDNNSRGHVYPQTLRDRRGSVKDTPNGPFTVFITNNTWEKFAGYYSTQGSQFRNPVYTESSDICVITWPEKRILGYKIIEKQIGDNFTVSSSRYRMVLSNENEISNWVASLPLK